MKIYTEEIDFVQKETVDEMRDRLQESVEGTGLSGEAIDKALKGQGCPGRKKFEGLSRPVNSTAEAEEVLGKRREERKKIAAEKEAGLHPLRKYRGRQPM